MVRPLLVSLVLGLSTHAFADEPTRGTPLRIALECQDRARTKACPEFLLGFIEASPLLIASPRANAQVVLYVNSAEIANDDRVHMRFVGKVRGAPESVETDVDLNTRGADDAQRAQLRPAFVRGLALYVAAINPAAVQIELVEAAEAALSPPATSPWGFGVFIFGQGDWTEDYRSANANASLKVFRLDRTSKYSAEAGAFGGLTRRPPIVTMGQEVSLDTTQWELYSSLAASHHLNDHWAAQTSTWLSHGDPKGQFRNDAGANIGLEWDRFPSDDPRGNVLAVGYFLALRVDDANFPDESGEQFYVYPFNRLSAAGKVRRDTTTYGLNLTLAAEILHPDRRHTLSISPSIEWQIGAHVDLAFQFSAGKRAVVQPVIPPDDQEAQGRAAYAQPLFASGFFTLNVHFDPTNGVRNNRFDNL